MYLNNDIYFYGGKEEEEILPQMYKNAFQFLCKKVYGNMLFLSIDRVTRYISI